MNLPRQSAICNVPVRKDAAARRAGFTMIEIALCLAVIGFALVAIIGVLPVGMNVQKDNREETVINFDANYLMDAIRSGSRGLDNLTNYVIAITNTSTWCHTNGVPFKPTQINWFTTTNYYIDGMGTVSSPALTNGGVIMGLLCQPKYVLADPTTGDYLSNSVTASFRAITGSPLDQGTSPTSKDFAFSYLVSVEIIPSAQFPYLIWDSGTENFSAPGSFVGTNNSPEVAAYMAANWPVAKNLEKNLQEIRLRFRWPYLPAPVNTVGNGAEIFRTSASGALIHSANAFSPYPGAVAPPVTYYLIQPLIYTNAP